MFEDVIVITLAADFFDQHTEKQKSIVAVRPATAGFEFGSALAVELHVVLQGAEFQTMSVELRAEEIASAAGMGKEVVDGDFGGDVLIGIVGKIFSEWIGELDFAGLDELKDGNGGEHFVHRAEAKTSVGFIGNFLLTVGQTVGAGEDGLAVLGDQKGAGKAISCSGLFHLGAESGEG